MAMSYRNRLTCRSYDLIGRIYQQTFVDTYSKVAACKLYMTKTPITAADLLNECALPMLEAHGIDLLNGTGDSLLNRSPSAAEPPNAADAHGNIIDETLGNGLRTIRGFESVAQDRPSRKRSEFSETGFAERGISVWVQVRAQRQTGLGARGSGMATWSRAMERRLSVQTGYANTVRHRLSQVLELSKRTSSED